jgi:hypothetical protein
VAKELTTYIYLFVAGVAGHSFPEHKTLLVQFTLQ